LGQRGNRSRGAQRGGQKGSTVMLWRSHTS
jgi:hypothetical protein